MYTYEPNEPNARAYGRNLNISRKDAVLLCNVIRKKKLNVVKRLLTGLSEGDRNLRGKYYTKASRQMLELIESCEKNAEFKGLDVGMLFVHASAHKSTTFRRRRRKSGYGSRMKNTNVEVILIERGKVKSGKTGKKDDGAKTEKSLAVKKTVEVKKTEVRPAEKAKPVVKETKVDAAVKPADKTEVVKKTEVNEKKVVAEKDDKKIDAKKSDEKVGDKK